VQQAAGRKALERIRRQREAGGLPERGLRDQQPGHRRRLEAVDREAVGQQQAGLDRLAEHRVPVGRHVVDAGPTGGQAGGGVGGKSSRHLLADCEPGDQ